jgi:hypothetical protein
MRRITFLVVDIGRAGRGGGSKGGSWDRGLAFELGGVGGIQVDLGHEFDESK